MNVAYFVVAFDEATDAVYEAWGLGLDYPAASGCSAFTLGMNVDYCMELIEGDPIRPVDEVKALALVGLSPRAALENRAPRGEWSSPARTGPGTPVV